jgi:DNA mismatch repair protein MutS
MNDNIKTFVQNMKLHIWGDEMSTKDKISMMNSVEYNQLELYTSFNKILQNVELDAFDISYHTSNTIILNDNINRDLEIFYDNKMETNCTIFNKINYTSTIFGEIVFKNLLNNPTVDVNELTHRQQIINKLLQSDKLYNNLQINFNILKQHEKSILWFWKDLDEYIDYVYDLVYYNNPFLQFINRNESILQLFNMYSIVVAPTISVCSPLVYIIIPFIICKIYKIPIKLNDILKILKTQITNGIKLDWKCTKSICYFFMSIGTWLFFYIQGIYYAVTMAINTNNIITILHNKINVISDCVTAINNTIPLVYETLPGIFKNNNLYQQITEKSNDFIKLFNNPIFTTKPSLFENKGKILSTYFIFKEQKNNLLCLLKYIGTVDMYLSFCKLYKSVDNTYNNYSFVKYLQTNKPTINVTDIWHPYIDNSIPNSVSIDTISNLLITGPNAAGKSTFIKSLAINILLAQTIGLSSSTNFELTPFYHINTYLHIPDCKGYDSLFQAEIHRCKNHIDTIKSLDPKQFSFVIMDEIFSSTNYNEGFSAAYSICKKLTTYNNSISIVTTHYTNLSILQQSTNKFTNYKFYVTYDDDKNIIFPFKIMKGISKQYIALELLRKNGFDDDIITTAINMCKQLDTKIKPKSKNINTKTIKQPNINTKTIKHKSKNINTKTIKQPSINTKTIKPKSKNINTKTIKDSDVKPKNTKIIKKLDIIKITSDHPCNN